MMLRGTSVITRWLRSSSSTSGSEVVEIGWSSGFGASGGSNSASKTVRTPIPCSGAIQRAARRSASVGWALRVSAWRRPAAIHGTSGASRSKVQGAGSSRGWRHSAMSTRPDITSARSWSPVASSTSMRSAG
ncbi:hypothetical protein [uncultured Variovorax sp.]|uniref:hypothetical protein n=1 Tax=uncultured Variovorax sp. TaxID=114708 RepID=UPI0025E83DB7|nr:hypothetical protein [uncultured Variovorax sp.]